MSNDKIEEIRARHEEGIRAGVDDDRAALLGEVERLTRERDEARSRETDYGEGFGEGWAAAQKGAAAEVERLREALTDMLTGWRYIRETYGDLAGIGWDRAESKAQEALETKP